MVSPTLVSVLVSQGPVLVLVLPALVLVLVLVSQGPVLVLVLVLPLLVLTTRLLLSYICRLVYPCATADLSEKHAETRRHKLSAWQWPAQVSLTAIKKKKKKTVFY